jgi:ribonuclease P protein subunit RPR2
MNRARGKPQKHVATGKERIRLLFEQAERAFGNDPALANRYAEIASKIAMRFNIRLEKQQKRKVCRKCHAYLVPGENCKVRTSAKRQSVTITCGVCGHVRRLPYSREKRAAKLI